MAGEPSERPTDTPSDGGPGDAGSEASGQQTQAKRRRTAGAASARGVANLTPEQLARKRANDREAQRAIRERTKQQIDRLHARIRELESQQPYHDLQLVIREKDAVLAENAYIRERLESVLSILSPIVRPPAGPNEHHAAAAAVRSPLPILAPPPPPPPPPEPRAYHATLGELAATPQNGVLSPRAWPCSTEGPSSQGRRWSEDPPQYHQERPHMTPDIPLDERMGVDFVLQDNNPNRHTTVTTHGVGQHAPVLVPYITLPRNTPSTCTLDSVLLDFLSERQSRVAAGEPASSVAGPPYPNLTAFMRPERAVESHPLSKLLTDVLRTFPDICGLPEQIAIVYVMFLTMRWQINPTRENYERIPDWMAPRACQLFVPHPVWIDHVPWPRLRDRLIHSAPPFLSFNTFFVPFTTTVSLNWPYDPADCLLPASRVASVPPSSSAASVPASSPYSTLVNAGSPPAVHTPGTTASSRDDDQFLINPAFDSHLRNLGNWSLGTAFRTAFPELSSCVRIKEGR